MLISSAAVLWAMATMAATPAGTLLSVHGTVDVARTDGSKVEAPPPGFELRVGDAITTGADGMVRASLMQAGVITLSSGSRLVISTAMVQDDGQVKAVVNLMKGKLRALVGGLFGRRVIFEAKTPNAVAGATPKSSDGRKVASEACNTKARSMTFLSSRTLPGHG